MTNEHYLVTFRIQNGEYHHYQHQTMMVTANDSHDTRANFRAERICSKLWGWGVRQDDSWFFDAGAIAASVHRVKPILGIEHNILKKYIG